jgi:hypothetical protein
MLRLFAAVLLVVLVSVVSLPQVAAQDDGRIVVAQVAKKPTLWDLLFGKKEEPPPPPPIAEPRQTSSPSITVLEPAKPEVAKSETATRLAVFGDSLAIDLTKALERAHADDPNMIVTGYPADASGFVRDDYFDWNKRLSELLIENAFDIAVVFIGINDRQSIGKDKALTDPWKAEYSARLERFLGQMRYAGKPVIWIGLPPMQKTSYSAAMTQISSLQRLAAFAGGAEFVDIYERFVDENGAYTSYGPDLNGQDAQMRKSDGIHFSRAGSDKVAFYVNQSLKRFYRGGTVSLEVADLLAGTDAEHMLRPPFQGLGQIRLLEIAGAVVPLTGAPVKAAALIEASAPAEGLGFDADDLMLAPAGRADAFGVGLVPREESAENRGR